MDAIRSLGLVEARWARRPQGAAAAGLSLVLAASVLLVSGGCRDRSDYEVKVPNFDPDDAATAALEAFDANGDGGLDSQELSSCLPLLQYSKSIDTDGDGRLSKEELIERLRTYVAANTGMQSLNCKVVANGRPLAGATVRFIPVEFLAGEIRPAAATTRANGTGPAIIEGTRLPGLSPGLYRVEISLATDGNERIAPQYNSESKLGYELMPHETPEPAEFKVGFR